MSRLLFSWRIGRALSGTKSLSPNSRTLFNTRVCLEDKDDEKNSKDQNTTKKAPQTDQTNKKEAARKKLEDLLQLMTNDAQAEKIPDVQLPRPRVEAQKKYHKMKAEHSERRKKIESEMIGSKLGKAASAIAEKLGGDTEQTERELLEIYLGRALKVPDNEVQESNIVGKEMVETKITTGEEPNMKDLLLSLKIEKPPPQEQSRAYQVRIYKRDKKAVHLPKMPLSRARSRAEKVDLFGAEPLNIFTTDEEGKKGPPAQSTMWEILEARDLRLSVTHPPANIFEQLIQWTEQGKIWKFPIDNEQDWEEQNVDFTEHVFLEHMLEPWCPSSGLIRQFMELVCVGLSKNPYLSVQEKHAHIIFYEHYFRHKNSLLVDLGLEPIKNRPPTEEQQEAIAAV